MSQMTQTQTLIWTQFGELFGADLLERRYGLVMPNTWRDDIDRLSAEQIAHGLASLRKSNLQGPPSMPQFCGMCRSAREFTTVLSASDSNWDWWAIHGNHSLMKHFEARRDHKRYHPDAKISGSHTYPGPEGTARTMLMVGAKNSWVADMRTEPDLTPKQREERWRTYIAQAEAWIDERIRGNFQTA